MCIDTCYSTKSFNNIVPFNLELVMEYGRVPLDLASVCMIGV